MPGFVYVMQPDDMPMFKVGMCSDPFARLGQMQPFSPHRLRFVRVLDVGCFWRAHAFEKHILSWLAPHQAWGEWCTSLEAIDEQLTVCAPALDVTDDFQTPPEKPQRTRRATSLAKLEDSLRVADENRAYHVSRLYAGAYLPGFLSADEPDVAKAMSRASRSPAEAAG